MTVKFRMLAIATGALALSAAPALAQSSTPGHQLQMNGAVNGQAGASGYSPGHQMQTNGSVNGQAGASGYAPGRTTGGAGVNGNTRMGVHKRGMSGGVNAHSGVNTHVR